MRSAVAVLAAIARFLVIDLICCVVSLIRPNKDPVREGSLIQVQNLGSFPSSAILDVDQLFWLQLLQRYKASVMHCLVSPLMDVQNSMMHEDGFEVHYHALCHFAFFAWLTLAIQRSSLLQQCSHFPQGHHINTNYHPWAFRYRVRNGGYLNVGRTRYGACVPGQNKAILARIFIFSLPKCDS